MTRTTVIIAIILAIGGALLVSVNFVACAPDNQEYIIGTREQRQALRHLWAEIDQHTLEEPQGLAAFELLIQQLIADGYPEAMHQLIVQNVLRNPENHYNAALLFLLANYYIDTEQPQLAIYYYRQIINNYRDVRYNGESVHLRSLINLTRLSADPNELAEYHRMLIYRFPEHIDVFSSYRSMIEQYRSTAHWELFFRTYRELIEFCEIHNGACQGNTERVEYMDNVQAKMRLFEANRYWTDESLDALVGQVKQALERKSVSDLLKWQAGANFFARSWEQEEFDFNSQINFNIGIFLRRSTVNFEQNLDSSSNTQEAYLRTWGWSHRIPTWYFYFRKIDFPADPEVHGNWEWAGIFFGELL